MKVFAIRSLQCRDHAENIPPKVKSIAWLLGKRCNYDCSYCSPHLHDAVSPFIDLKSALSFVNGLHADSSYRIKWSFTGGEPFLDPGFIPLIQHIFDSGRSEQINVTTNGSLPLSVYKTAAACLKGITFSLHLERSVEEINATLEKIVWLKNNTTCLISVNLMFMPGTMQQVAKIQKILVDHSVSFIIRKITPPVDYQPLLPYVKQDDSRKNVTLLAKDTQTINKTAWHRKINFEKTENLTDYYSEEEISFVESANHQPGWANLGAWTDQGYIEMNSDALTASDKNRFKDWICYAGVDHIMIDFDGSIYRAQCYNDRKIGHFADDDWKFMDSPTICNLEWCNCNTDIPIRKSCDDYWHSKIS